MALSEDLKKLYSSNPIVVRAYDCIFLSHSLFLETHYFINDSEPRTLQVDDGAGGYTTHTFQPFGFGVVKPEKGSNQQDMALSLDNVEQLAGMELERASENMDEPIVFQHIMYIDGSDLPQTSALVLELTNITATQKSITATATRVNLFGLKVPTRNYESFIFKGLR